MRSDRPLIAWVVALLVTVLLRVPPVAAATHHQVLYAFPTANDGAIPWAGLVADAAGILYGTTSAGGTYGYGTVFRLTPGAHSTWSETVLHSFNSDGADGSQPEGGLILDEAGNLYGTTTFGGSYYQGTVFELSPGKNDTWVESVLHSFNGTDGGRPAGCLIFDAAGNLYGTTTGTPPSRGSVFKLTSGSDGKWTETVLHSFTGGKDGGIPFGGLIFDAAGNLYGTTSVGGAYLYFGSVFKLTPGPHGKWRETVLHAFSSKNGDGAYPYDSLALDAAGNLYGTAYAGGQMPCFGGCGIVFKLAPETHGQWTETILYSFTGGADGGEPYAGLTFDQGGNLYGTTNFGGEQQVCSSGCGVVFKLTPVKKGKWSETVLHAFSGNDGEVPDGNLIFDADGNLYGTTLNGGDFNCHIDGGNSCGVVFKLKP